MLVICRMDQIKDRVERSKQMLTSRLSVGNLPVKDKQDRQVAECRDRGTVSKDVLGERAC